MFFDFFARLDSFFWGYIAFVLIMLLGCALTFRSRFFQLIQFPAILKIFWNFLRYPQSDKKGVHPIKTFLASTGGMIGIGNVVGVATAVQCGGPGALFWLWIAGIFGAILKYSEIYLGCKYRVENAEGGYDGGPLLYLKKAFRSPILPAVTAVLLCVYGVEIYQFSVITESVSSNWSCPHFLSISILVVAVLWASLGGVKRISQICSWIVPIFLVIYLAMGVSIIYFEAGAIPHLFATVFKSAFTGHAAIGGFAGGSMILAVQNGIARAAYSADIGIGYDSIIQSESSATAPTQQASLAIVGVFIDNLICTITILIVLASGSWHLTGEGSEIVQVALSRYFPFMEVFLPLFYIFTGYTTIIAYFCVGIKCCSYLFPRRGKIVYLLFGALMFTLFSFAPQGKALLIMSVSGAMLLIINLLGMYRLRKEISFVESVVAINN